MSVTQLTVGSFRNHGNWRHGNRCCGNIVSVDHHWRRPASADDTRRGAGANTCGRHHQGQWEHCDDRRCQHLDPIDLTRSFIQSLIGQSQPPANMASRQNAPGKSWNALSLLIIVASCYNDGSKRLHCHKLPALEYLESIDRWACPCMSCNRPLPMVP